MFEDIAGLKGKLNPELVEDLRTRAREGASVGNLLRFLVERLQPLPIYSFTLISYFRVSFLLPVETLTHIGGWDTSGQGEMSDERLEQLVRPALDANRRHWDSNKSN